VVLDRRMSPLPATRNGFGHWLIEAEELSPEWLRGCKRPVTTGIAARYPAGRRVCHAFVGQQNGGSLDHAAVGDPMEGLFVFDPDQFPLGSGDDSTFIAIRDPWDFPLDLLRTRLLIGGVPFPTEDPAYTRTLSVIEGVGQRVGRTGNFGFVFNDPERPTRRRNRRTARRSRR